MGQKRPREAILDQKGQERPSWAFRGQERPFWAFWGQERPLWAFMRLQRHYLSLCWPLKAQKGLKRPYLGLKRPYCPAGGLLVPNKALWAKDGQERQYLAKKAKKGILGPFGAKKGLYGPS